MLKVSRNLNFSSPFEITQNFEYNVEAFITNSKDFSFYVGEGPLYWYRIDWYPSICTINTCEDFTPIISYIEVPNCPYEIIEDCLILPPDCPCDPICHPKDCIRRDVEIWHMLATGVTHLCERINQECCNRKPPGFMRRVRQYTRPALCCDVPYPASDAIDTYVDVDFLNCECGNLVDPCIARFVYPCHINRCGIHGPVFVGDDPIPANTIKLTEDILGYPVKPIAEVIPVPKIEILPTKPAIPEIIHCSYDIVKPDIVDLYHNKEHKAWQGVKSYKDWKFIFEWIPSLDGYKLKIFVDHEGLKSKAILMIRDNYKKEVNLNFTNQFKSSNKLLQSRIVHDDINIFNKELKVNLKW